jgi:putative toxin-antitoxin system antitoxin component (TIGR02293 family)
MGTENRRRRSGRAGGDFIIRKSDAAKFAGSAENRAPDKQPGKTVSRLNTASSLAAAESIERRKNVLGHLPAGIESTELVEQGLPVSSVDELRREGLTFSEVHGLVLPARTLKHRIAKKQRLSMEETDRVVRVARVMALADEVFGNREKALGWLRRGNKRLRDRAPLEMLRSEVGGELVRQMLHQLDEGIYV